MLAESFYGVIVSSAVRNFSAFPFKYEDMAQSSFWQRYEGTLSLIALYLLLVNVNAKTSSFLLYAEWENWLSIYKF